MNIKIQRLLVFKSSKGEVYYASSHEAMQKFIRWYHTKPLNLPVVHTGEEFVVDLDKCVMVAPGV